MNKRDMKPHLEARLNDLLKEVQAARESGDMPHAYVANQMARADEVRRTIKGLGL